MNLFSNRHNIHKFFKSIKSIKFSELLAGLSYKFAFLLKVFLVSACGIPNSNYKIFDKDLADVSDHEEFFGDGSRLSGIYNEDYNLFLTYLNKSKSFNQASTFQFVTCSSEVLTEQTEYCTLDDADNAENADNDNILNKCPEQNVLAKHCVPAFQGSLIIDWCHDFRKMQNICSMAEAFLQEYKKNECMSYIHDPDAEDEKRQACIYNINMNNQCQRSLPAAAAICEPALEYLELNCDDEVLADKECQELDFDPKSRKISEVINPHMDFITRFSAGFYADYERFLSRKQNNAALFFNGVSNGSLLPIFFSKKGISTFNQFGQPALNKIIKNPKWWLSGLFNFVKINAFLSPKITYDWPIHFKHQEYTIIGSCFQMLNKMNYAPYIYPPFEEINDAKMTLAKQIIPTSLGLVSNWAIIRATSNYSPSVRFGSMVILPFVATIMSFLNTDHSTDDVYNNLDQIFQQHETLPASNDFELTKLRVDMHKLLPLLARSVTYFKRTHYTNMQRYCLPKLQDGEYVSECFPIYDGDEGLLYRLGQNTTMDELKPSAAEICEAIFQGDAMKESEKAN